MLKAVFYLDKQIPRIACYVLMLSSFYVDGQTEEAEGNTVDDEIVVMGRKLFEDKPLSFQLDAKALKRIPGVQDDPLRAIVTLPGVAVNSDFDGGVAIRGSRPADNLFYLDFLPVGYLFHLTGLSVIEGELISGIGMYPAGYGAEFQGVTGGVIDATTRAPVSTGSRARVDLSILDTGVVFERALGEKQRVSVSARISYYDLILGNIITDATEDENEGLDIVQLPQYRDYRVKYQNELTPNWNLDVFVDGAFDEVELLFDDTSNQAILDPVLSGSHRFNLQYDRQGVLFTHNLPGASEFKLGIAHIANKVSGRFGGAGEIGNDNNELLLRTTYQHAKGAHEIKVGALISRQKLDYDILVRDNGCTEFDVDCLFSDNEFVTARGKRKFVKGSMFIEDRFRFGEHFEITPGLAVSFDDYLDETEFEPRIQASYDVTNVFTLSFGAGRYTQIPSFDYTEEVLGNPELDYLKADHYVFGFDLLIPSSTLLSVDFYYKKLKNLVTSDPVVRYTNDGVGDVWGAEFLLRTSRDKFSGWFSISYSESVRQDGTDGEKFDFAFDQPIIASLIAKYEFSERFVFSGRAAYHSGPPVTPILSGRPNPDQPGHFLPNYGAINSERLPAYFRLDMRMDWNIRPNTTLYFELINATNSENVAAYEYNADYSDRKNIEQLPNFISFGFEKTWVRD